MGDYGLKSGSAKDDLTYVLARKIYLLYMCARVHV